MDFEFSPKVKDMQAQLLAFMDQHIYPNEATYLREAENRAKGNAWIPTKVIEELKPRRARRACGTCSCRARARRRPEQPRIRAAVRDHGPRPLGARGVQLLGARHRQHGDLERYGSEAQKDAGSSRCSTAKSAPPS
jgi:acyl-CoA dehydrogenase